MIYEEAGDEGKEDEAYQVASGGAGELSDSSGEGGEYGEAHCSQEKVGDEADGSKFHTEDVDGEIDGQVGKGDRNRTEGQRDAEGAQYACYGCHYSDEGELFGCDKCLLDGCIFHDVFLSFCILCC